jgi:hypothetical protein
MILQAMILLRVYFDKCSFFDPPCVCVFFDPISQPLCMPYPPLILLHDVTCVCTHYLAMFPTSIYICVSYPEIFSSMCGCVLPYPIFDLYLCVLSCFQPLSECVSYPISILYMTMCACLALFPAFIWVCVCVYLALPLSMYVSYLISNLFKTWNLLPYF